MSDEPVIISAEQARALRHDVRSPLMVISGFARMLAGDRPLTDEERREYCQRIEQAADELRRTIDAALGG